MFLLLVFALGIGLPSPAQQQQSAGALYRMLYRVTAHGSFTFDFADAKKLHLNEQDMNFALASAVAVDPDGWLLTARHAADVELMSREFCQVMEERWTRFRIDQVALSLELRDIVGNQYFASYTVTPPAGSRDDVCHSSGALTVHREKVFPVRIVALDSHADLALMKIELHHGPIRSLEWGSSKNLEQLAPVYGFGYTDMRAPLAMRGGFLVRGCEVQEPDVVVPSVFARSIHAQPERLMRFVLDSQSGMSGGPVVAEGRLVGVIVRQAATQGDAERGLGSVQLTMAVPSDYALAWYRSVRWSAKFVRPTVVCVPTPE